MKVFLLEARRYANWMTRRTDTPKESPKVILFVRPVLFSTICYATKTHRHTFVYVFDTEGHQDQVTSALRSTDPASGCVLSVLNDVKEPSTLRHTSIAKCSLTYIEYLWITVCLYIVSNNLFVNFISFWTVSTDERSRDSRYERTTTLLCVWRSVFFFNRWNFWFMTVIRSLKINPAFVL